MKIVLVNLYDYSLLRWMDTPIGIQSLYLLLKKKSNYDVEVCDFNNLYYIGEFIDRDLDSNIEDMANYLNNLGPDIVSIYTMCNNYYIAILLSKALKEKNSKINIILGGPQATMVARETLEQYPFIDLIGMGEGESTILDIVKSIGAKNYEHANGLAYRRDNKEIVVAWNRKDYCDINSLELIKPHELKPQCNKTFEAISIEVGRGCPFACTYCSTQFFWGNNYRIKSLDKIINEVKYYVEEYGIKEFSFQHDLFTYSKKHIVDFCNTLINNNLNIKWGCSSRIDVLTEEMVKTMSNSGCTKIFFGIETGSKKIQKLINKNLNIEKTIEMAKTVAKYNIESIFSFIYGYPDENEEDLNDTLLLMYNLKKLDINGSKITLQLWPMNFLPGTKMGKDCYDSLVYNNFSRMDFSYSKYLNNHEVSELIKSNKSIFLNYYDLPKNISMKNRCLNFVIANLLNKTYAYIQTSFDLLLQLFDYNILKIYYNIYDYCDTEIEKLCIYNVRVKESTIKDQTRIMIECINNYFLKSGLANKEKCVYSVFSFEKDIFEFLHFDNKNYLQKEYEYNVLNIRRNKQLEKEKESIKLIFEKKNGQGTVKQG